MLQLILVSLAAISLYVVLMLFVGYILGMILNFLIKKYGKNSKLKFIKNIGSADRSIRFILFIVLFIIGLINLSNPIYLITSGFCLFEALNSWCVFYSLLGKNTCPIN